MAQHTVASWMYGAINEQHSTVGCSLSLDQPSGIHFQTNSEMRLRTLVCDSVSRALCTNLLTCLLTFWQSLKTLLFRQY